MISKVEEEQCDSRLVHMMRAGEVRYLDLQSLLLLLCICLACDSARGNLQPVSRMLF